MGLIVGAKTGSLSAAALLFDHVVLVQVVAEPKSTNGRACAAAEAPFAQGDAA